MVMLKKKRVGITVVEYAIILDIKSICTPFSSGKVDQRQLELLLVKRSRKKCVRRLHIVLEISNLCK